MYGGFSGSQGILIYEKKKDCRRAIYGYYEEDDIKIIEGEYEALVALRKERERPHRIDDKKLDRAIVGLFLGMLTMLIVLFLVGSFRIFVAALLFCLLGYMPILIITFANQKRYIDEEREMQFKRNHGCEHATVSFLTKEKQAVTLEELKKMPIYDGECGTMYAVYLLFLAVEIALLIALPLQLGLLKSVAVVLITIVLLVINVFNPKNPFFIVQRPVVNQPGDREYALGLALIERMKGIEDREKV